MRIRCATLLLMLLSSALRAQDPPVREVNGHTLTSRSDPAASFEIGTAFRYVGS